MVVVKARVEESMNIEYMEIFKKHDAVNCETGLSRPFIFQHDNDATHTHYPRKTKVNVIKSPAQSPDFNPIEICGRKIIKSGGA